MQTLIKNGILYTMTEDKGIFQGDILVEGTKIKEVAEHISEDCLEDGDKLQSISAGLREWLRIMQERFHLRHVLHLPESASLS